MNRSKTNRSEEKRAGIERSVRIDRKIEVALAGEEELIPTSGFLATVMERVEQEASAPPPIPFPWKRVVLGIVLATGVFCWGAVELVRNGPPAVNFPAFTQPHLSVALMASVEQAGWVALALGVSLLSWLFARRLAGRGGLL
jgi:hypothetical protein